jgi:hypothetical protein
MRTQELKKAAKVAEGLWSYYTRGDVSLEARRALLDLHCETNGRFTDTLAKAVRMVRPARRPAPVKGFLGDLSVERETEFANLIARDGFYNFGPKIPVDVCDAITEYALRTSCTVEGRGSAPENRMIFDPAAAPVSKTYRIPESECIKDHAVQKLMADPSMLAIAEIYLRTHPILSGTNVWWSATFGNEPGGDAAQEFHFDFDPPPIWLLFFVYLTDVGPDNGPHVYARGTHLSNIPAAGPLLARGYVRIPDQDVAAAFGKDSIVELHGKRGTVLAVDTRGFHKGKMLTTGHRLMAQLTYSCPPYSGAHARRQTLPADLDPSLAAAIKATPRVFQKYT